MMRSLTTLLLLAMLSGAQMLFAANETEPNNTFSEANFIQQSTAVTGAISSISDLDYYVFVPNEAGTVVIPFSFSGGSGTGTFVVTAYSKNQTSIGSLSKPNLASGTDSLKLFCRQADTMYFRINANESFSYQFSFRVDVSGFADVEPNNTFQEARMVTAGQAVNGRIGYSSSALDANDYFMTVLPEDGTMRLLINKINTSNSEFSSFTVDVYRKDFTGIGRLLRLNVPTGNAPQDTLDIFCRAADTVYVRVSSSGCFSYNFTYQMLSLGSRDAEPNNTFDEASLIQAGQQVNGRIGYSTNSLDANDYFVSLAPASGTFRFIINKTNTSNDVGSLNFLVYSQNRSQIGNINRTNVPIGIAPTDTLDIYCRAADTLFIRLNAFSCFSYSFRYEVLNSGPDDQEPNNTIQTAIIATFKDTLRGGVGYRDNFLDSDDIYRFTPTRVSTVTIRLQYENTSNSTDADLRISRLNKFGNVVSTFPFLDRPLGISNDSIVLTCLPADTFFLNISAAACFRYNIRFDVIDEEPQVEIFSSRMGNTFGFVADNNRNTDVITWNFGDGSTSNLRLPVKTFNIGEYSVVLQGTNTRCNITRRDTMPVSVFGIEYFKPRRAGNVDDIGFFDLRIFGGGLDTNATIRLRNGGTVLTPFKKASPGGAELTALFRFSGAVTGFYDVEISLSNGYDTIIPNGFEVFEDVPGYEINVTLQGPPVVRTGIWTNYTLNVYNNRARVANSVVACLVVPEGVEANLTDIIGTQSGTLLLKGSAWDKLTIPFEFFNNVYFEGAFDPDIDTVLIDYDEVYQYKDQLMGISIDSLFDKPYKGTVYHLLLPVVGANSTERIQFQMRSSVNTTEKIYTYAFPYNLRQNPLSAQALDNIHFVGTQSAAILEYSPNPALKAVGKSAGYVDVGSQVLFTEFFDWYYGVNNADEAFYAKQSVSLLGTLASSKVPFGKKYEDGIEQIETTKRALEYSTKRISQNIDVIDWTKHPEIKNQLISEIVAYRNFIENSPGLTDLQKEAALNGLSNWLTGQGINLTSNELGDLLSDAVSKTSNYPDQLNSRDFQAVNSFDPNEIYGPTGYNTERFVKRDQSLSYQVTFENVDTAKAPAQIVAIDLQLDPQKYDLSQTVLGDIAIANTTYFFERDRNTYFRDVDLRPAKNMIVRVNATLDTISGKIRWIFTSLDPVTKDFITDPLDGFLPPNILAPQGEGSVSFTTKLKDRVANNEAFTAFASIVFDNNEPILTSTWSNRLDDKKPASTLSPNAEVVNDSVIIINASGSDDGSGLELYRLFIKINDGAWWTEGLPVYTDQEIRIVRNPTWTYAFYVEGVDSVGNSEGKTPNAELVVSAVTNVMNHATSLQNVLIYPNPARSEVSILGLEDQRSTTVTLFDMSGKEMMSSIVHLSAGSPTRINVQSLPTGMYILQLTGEGKNPVSQKLTIIR